MKKILAVSFCTTLVLGFAASAFAIHIEAPAETSGVVAKGGLVTLDGSVRTRGYLSSTDTAKDATMQKAGYDQRVRLGASVKTGDQVSGRVVLESGSDLTDVYTWGSGSSAGLNMGGDKQGSLDILEAWIQYEPGNWGVKAGHMPLALGNKLFFDHTKFGDDAIVAFMNPNDATHIAALTIKFEEGASTKYSDDINGLVLLGTYKAGAMNFSADWTYLTQGTDAALPDAGPPVVFEGFPGLSLSNIGLRGDMDAGNFKLKGDVEFQTGQVIEKDGVKADAAGWAGMLDASTKLGGAWTLGAGLYYATGDKYDETDTDVDTFINFLGALRYQSTMNGYILASPATTDIFGTNVTNRGISNQTIVQIYGSTTTQMMGKDLDLKARLNWMKVNEEQYANQDDAIGTEIELFANWKLAQGLVYGVEAAYLFTGDAWIPEGAVAGTDVDNVFFLRHRLELAW